VFRESVGEREPIRSDPVVYGFDDCISRRRFGLAAQYPNGNKYLNPASRHWQCCVFFDLEESSLKEREVLFLFLEWLYNRVLYREVLPSDFLVASASTAPSTFSSNKSILASLHE